MSVAHVQAKSFSEHATDNAVAVTFTSAVSSGSLVCGLLFWSGTTDTITAIDDDKGNTYTKVDTLLNIESDGRSALSFYAKNLTNAPQTITAHFSDTPSDKAITVREVSGAHHTTPLDKNVAAAQSNPGTGTDAITSGSQTTTTNGQYVAGFSTAPFAQHDVGWLNAGTGYSNKDDAGNVAASEFYIASESRIQSAAGSIAATFTQASAGAEDYGTFLLTFFVQPTGPTINLQPGSQSVRVGDTATFDISATTSGGTLHYDWEVDTGGGFANATGATDAPTYQTPTLTSGEDGDIYRCNVSDDNGTTVSTSATLHVRALAGCSLGQFDPEMRIEAWF
jgi:hypothetical protein